MPRPPAFPSPSARPRPVSRARRLLAGLAVVAGLLVTGLAGACTSPSGDGGAGSTESAAREPVNVVVVLVDTLRADHLGTYGYERPTSPALDAFAASAVLFEEGRSQAPCTFPSVNSLLTGLPATLFLGRGQSFLGIPDDLVSLPEILAAEGWATLAVSASPIVRANATRFNPDGGFARGFQVFEERCLWGSAACMEARAVPLIEITREPFFLYLHYMEPHGPYGPPEEWERPFSDPDHQGPDWVLAGDPNPVARAVSQGSAHPVEPRHLEHLKNLYDDEIAYFDQAFPRLVGALEERGVLERTLLVVVADHGESFLEHGRMKHCNSLYDTEIKTPFVVHAPGMMAGRRPAADVANLDLVPTILDYAGIEAPEPLPGRSLRPLLEGADAWPEGDDRPVPAAWSTLRAAVHDGWKMVWDVKTDEWSLYDLRSDPGEQVDVLGDHPEIAQRLRRAVRSQVMAEGGREGAREAEGSEERLRALGYIQ